MQLTLGLPFTAPGLLVPFVLRLPEMWTTPVETEKSVAGKPTADLARVNKLLAALPEAELNYLLPALHLVDYSFDSTISDLGTVIHQVVFPIDSVVSSLAVTEDGAAIEVAMVGCEGLTGISAMLGHYESRHWTKVCAAGFGLTLDVSVLDELFEQSSAAQRALLDAYRSLIAQVQQRSMCNARHSILERLCCWLLMVRDRVGGNDLRLTQESMAMRLGSRRAGISSAAAALREMNAITYHRGLVQISDREVLEHVVCECYKVIKEEFQRPLSGTARYRY
jgi:CRP-like cAMP-binding protein